MQKRAKNLVFGYIAQLEWFDEADILYSDRCERCSSTKGNADDWMGH